MDEYQGNLGIRYRRPTPKHVLTFMKNHRENG